VDETRIRSSNLLRVVSGRYLPLSEHGSNLILEWTAREIRIHIKIQTARYVHASAHEKRVRIRGWKSTPNLNFEITMTKQINRVWTFPSDSNPNIEFNNTTTQQWEVSDQKGRVRFCARSRSVCLEWEQVNLPPE